MATGVITNRLLDPSGTALSGVTVNARLMPSPTGFRSVSFYEISQLETTTTDGNGDYALVLEQNTGILPGDSYWQIEECIPVAAGVPRVWSVQVGAGTATLYASLVSTPPDVSVPSYITQSSGDARYMPFGALTIGSVQAVGTNTATGTATTAAASNHVHPLNPSVIGSGLALTAGVISATNLTNSNATSGLLFTRTNTATATVGTPLGQLTYNSNSLAVYINTGPVRVDITPTTAVVATSETTASTSYVDLATPGPAVSVLTGTRALVTISAATTNSGVATNLMAVAVSGATTVAAADGNGMQVAIPSAGYVFPLVRTFAIGGLTPGLNTFTLKYETTATTATFLIRDITVVGLP